MTKDERIKRALIIGASGGIGGAVSANLRAQGVDVTGLSRSADGFDVTEETSIVRHLSALEPGYDLILVATGALEIEGTAPEKTIRDLEPQAMAAQFALNTIGPAMVLKHGARLLAKDRRAVMAVLSARVGSIGDNRLGGWYSYRVAKAGVNQMVHSFAIELGRSHSRAICVALHPGTVATRFTQNYQGRHPTVAPQDAAGNLLSVIEGLAVEDSGGFYDWAGSEVEW
ncbi:MULTISPECIES: SDR family NAD(P)-dependent oxidoreductase [unclassified Marinovum]